MPYVNQENLNRELEEQEELSRMFEEWIALPNEVVNDLEVWQRNLESEVDLRMPSSLSRGMPSVLEQAERLNIGGHWLQKGKILIKCHICRKETKEKESKTLPKGVYPITMEVKVCPKCHTKFGYMMKLLRLYKGDGYSISNLLEYGREVTRNTYKHIKMNGNITKFCNICEKKHRKGHHYKKNDIWSIYICIFCNDYFKYFVRSLHLNIYRKIYERIFYYIKDYKIDINIRNNLKLLEKPKSL